MGEHGTGAPGSAALYEDSAEELYEQAPCGYVTTRPDGTLVRVNQTFLTWLGFSRQELVGQRRLQDLLNVGGRIFYETHLGPLLRMQGALTEIQVDFVRKDGSTLPVLLNASERLDERGEPQAVRITVFNIEDRKRFERELVIARKRAEDAARAKAEFLSMMSHEIRTPMSAIMGVTGLLQKTALTDQQRRYIKILQSSSDNLLALLNDILDFSRLEAGKAPLESRPFNLRELVYETLFGLSARAEEKRLTLQAEIDDRSPRTLRGDPIKIGQVLTNLVSNAIKFTHQGGVFVDLKLLHESSETVTLLFSVRDTGIGIPADRISGLFDEFSQASYEIGVKYGGSGLGLAISRKILELYGTRMSVTSQEGVGSVFSFELRLPVSRDDATPTFDDGGDEGSDLAGLRLLVAEDNEINRFVLVNLLERWGVKFDVARNGREAIELASVHSYDLILMDVRMPEMDGYEAVRQIRGMDGGRMRELPILAITASTRIGLEDRTTNAGFTEVLGKPFKPATLRRKIGEHTGRIASAAAYARGELPKRPA